MSNTLTRKDRIMVTAYSPRLYDSRSASPIGRKLRMMGFKSPIGKSFDARPKHCATNLNVSVRYA